MSQRHNDLPAHTSAYRHISDLIARDICVVLDGGTTTELPPKAYAAGADERLWGTSALIDAPGAVSRIHRSYVDVGCDVITTNTWGLPSALTGTGSTLWNPAHAINWMDVARCGVQLARQAVREGGRGSPAASAPRRSTCTPGFPRNATT